MTYQINGLDPEIFRPVFAMTDDELAKIGAQRVVASADQGFPCRISLTDAAAGSEMILLHHVSHDVATPYRSAYAIYVGKDAEPAAFSGALPPVFSGRPLGMRGFDAGGILRDARLALPGAAEAAITALFANPDIAYIHAHNAAHGCFSARIDRG